MMALVLSAGVMSLAACGVKSVPAFPSDGVYPRQYPNPDIQTTTPVTAPGTAPATGPAEKTKDDTRSPLGFPLEYPNRPSYN
jgi:hypothetical protein